MWWVVVFNGTRNRLLNKSRRQQPNTGMRYFTSMVLARSFTCELFGKCTRNTPSRDSA